MIVWLSDKWRLMNSIPEVNGKKDLFTDKMNNAYMITQLINDHMKISSDGKW